MKCFYHPQIEAVAICKNCGKGLCFECASDVGNGVACKGKCESEVQALNEQLLRNRTMHLKSSEAHMKSTIFLSMIGFFFVGFSFYMHDKFSFAFILPAGVIFLVVALLFYRLAKKLKQQK
ncbi:MAG TPA: hypothetical protein VFV23_00550 [Verrucomicrobiae bacterium]|nr:hypothetical protein [Verrucomicrobiae bacterium]